MEDFIQKIQGEKKMNKNQEAIYDAKKLGAGKVTVH